ncbi:MAG: hypothetical protein II236_02515 [Alistipes sp.]|nr:hypothetical protein [Alistipes sp.]
MTYYRILQLCLCIVLVIDISGAVESLRSFVGKWLQAPAERVRLKPLDCSKCMTVWLGLGYALIVRELTLSVALYTLLLAVMTPNLATLICITIEAVRNLLDKIFRTIC